MPEFEVDDFVRCIDNAEYERDLTIGKIYKIHECQRDMSVIRIINNRGHNYGYKQYRFKIVSLNEVMILNQFEAYEKG